MLNKVNPKAEPNSKNISKERHEKQKKSMNIKNIQKVSHAQVMYCLIFWYSLQAQFPITKISIQLKADIIF